MFSDSPGGEVFDPEVHLGVRPNSRWVSVSRCPFTGGSAICILFRYRYWPCIYILLENIRVDTCICKVHSQGLRTFHFSCHLLNSIWHMLEWITKHQMNLKMCNPTPPQKMNFWTRLCFKILSYGTSAFIQLVSIAWC